MHGQRNGNPALELLLISSLGYQDGTGQIGSWEMKGKAKDDGVISSICLKYYEVSEYLPHPM